MRHLYALAVLLLAACTTGDQVKSLHPGMSKQEVVAQMGQPDGYQQQGNTEALTYANRLMTGWSWDRADYHVILVDDAVTAYGPGTIRQNSPPGGVTTLVLVQP